MQVTVGNLSSLSADIQDLHLHTNLTFYSKLSKKSKPIKCTYTYKTAEAKLCDGESALSFITGKKRRTGRAQYPETALWWLQAQWLGHCVWRAIWVSSKLLELECYHIWGRLFDHRISASALTIVGYIHFQKSFFQKKVLYWILLGICLYSMTVCTWRLVKH